MKTVEHIVGVQLTGGLSQSTDSQSALALFFPSHNYVVWQTVAVSEYIPAGTHCQTAVTVTAGCRVHELIKAT